MYETITMKNTASNSLSFLYTTLKRHLYRWDLSSQNASGNNIVVELGQSCSFQRRYLYGGWVTLGLRAEMWFPFSSVGKKLLVNCCVGKIVNLLLENKDFKRSVDWNWGIDPPPNWKYIGVATGPSYVIYPLHHCNNIAKCIYIILRRCCHYGDINNVSLAVHGPYNQNYLAINKTNLFNCRAEIAINYTNHVDYIEITVMLW